MKIGNAEKKEILAMRVDGYTYQEIGDKFGITKERVRQIIQETAFDRPKEPKKKKYKYTNFFYAIVHQYGEVATFTREIGVPQTTIYTWLSGKLPTNIKTLLKVCKALDEDIYHLFEEEMRV